MGWRLRRSERQLVPGYGVTPRTATPRSRDRTYSYWKRGLDMYTLVQQMVDEQIGKVVAAVPKSLLGNTVFVFASDHGEYAGAHGLLSGKLGTAYEENPLPLVVTDRSHCFM